MNKWHWFKYHFQFYKYGIEHPFAKSIVDAMLNIEKKIDGYSVSTINRMAELSGKEKYEPHYEQLLQICSEIYVINQASKYFYDTDAIFKYEPSCGDSKKNPEITIQLKDCSIGIEVKQPSLFNHIRKRGSNSLQVSTRVPDLLDILKEKYNENITLPRDNPVKDFLISANGKFRNFTSDKSFYSILFIIWDDFIYEPISALLGEPSGLLLEGSFAKDKDGKSLKFENIDAVFLDRQLVQIINATRDEPLLYNKTHAMDYGLKNEFPYKVVIPVNKDRVLPAEILDCFQVWNLEPSLGAEYNPSDLILWL